MKIAVFAAIGALVVLALAGRERSDVGPFDTTLTIRPSLSGVTTVMLPPLGSIQLDTHDAPVAVELRVDELQLAAAEEIAADPALVEEFGDTLADDVRSALLWLAFRCTLAAVIGGAIGAVLAHTSVRSAAVGALAGLVFSAGVGGATAATFNGAAIAEPRYTGILTVAPRAVGDVETILDRVDQYRAQLSDLVENVVSLYRAAEGIPVAPAGESIRILHVSDNHLNPQAFDLIEQVARRFSVDAVADTGDITDWGTEPESQFISRIGSLPVPYVWVRGNHDSHTTQEAVAGQPNAVVLDGNSAEVAGLRFWGIGDPRYTPDKDQEAKGPGEREVADLFADDVRRELDRDEPPPVDVALVHDRRTARLLGDRVPLVLAGHIHRAEAGRLGKNTILLSEGSTGGAGLRGLQGDKPKPLQCSILYFDPATRRLIAYDRISVSSLDKTGVTINRTVIDRERKAQGERPGTTTTTVTGGTTTSTSAS